MCHLAVLSRLHTVEAPCPVGALCPAPLTDAAFLSFLACVPREGELCVRSRAAAPSPTDGSQREVESDERSRRSITAAQRPAVPVRAAIQALVRPQRMYGGISEVTLSRSNPRAKRRWLFLGGLTTVLLLSL